MTNSGIEPRDLEQLAAFIERRMSDEERRAFMGRLDREEALYEVFVDTVRFRDQQAGQGATVVSHPRRWRWGRLAAVAAVVAVAVATPVLLRNLSGERYAASLVADGTLEAVLDADWHIKGWAVMRGVEPGTDEFDTAFRLGVRQVEVEVSLRLGRRDDADRLTGEMERLLGAVPLSEPLQLLYAAARQTGEPDQALRQIEEGELLLRDHLGEAVAAFDLGVWTEVGILAARSGNTDLLHSPVFESDLAELRRQDWPTLADQLAGLAALLEPPAEQIDLARLEVALTAIVEQS